MSPEQLEGRDADARGDLWALGCVLCEMTTGKRAFEGSAQASLISAISATAAAVTQLSPLSPPALRRLVSQCPAKDPEERWQSAGDVRRGWWIRGGASQSGAASVRRPTRLPAWAARG
jgi:serine/threonine-protein kinase